MYFKIPAYLMAGLHETVRNAKKWDPSFSFTEQMNHNKILSW